MTKTFLIWAKGGGEFGKICSHWTYHDNLLQWVRIAVTEFVLGQNKIEHSSEKI